MLRRAGVAFILFVMIALKASGSYASEQKAIRVGVDELTPHVKTGKIGVLLTFTPSSPLSTSLPFDLDVQAKVTLYELVWDTKRWTYSEVPFAHHLVHIKGVDVTAGTTDRLFQIPAPNKRANWRLTVDVASSNSDVRFDMNKEPSRYFSTYEPADISPGEPYTFVVFPDTQIFSQDYPTIYTRMTDWVAQHARALNIVAVLHVGDITNKDTPEQWENAYASMSLLHGVAPYVLSLGNHDMKAGGSETRRNVSLIDHYFSVDEAKRYSHLVETMTEHSLGNHYHVLSVGDVSYVIISLEFAPPDEAVAWAAEVADNYPDHRFILLTHSYTDRSGRRSEDARSYQFPGDVTTINTGPDLWRKLIARRANSFMVVSGHLSVPFTVPFNVGQATTGQAVYELLFDYQREGIGGAGRLGVLTFQPDETVDVRVYSPYLGRVSQERDRYGFGSHVRLYLNEGRAKSVATFESLGSEFWIEPSRNLLVNPDFEGEIKANRYPVGWVSSGGGVGGQDLWVEQSDNAYSGKNVLVLNQGDRDSVAVQSDRVRVKAGKYVHATARIRNSAGKKVGLYLRFYDETDTRIAQHGEFVESTGWAAPVVRYVAPEGTAYARVLVWQGGRESQRTMTYVDDVKLTTCAR